MLNYYAVGHQVSTLDRSQMNADDRNQTTQNGSLAVCVRRLQFTNKTGPVVVRVNW